MQKSKLRFTAIFLVLIFSFQTSAAPGDLDLTFGPSGGGFVVTSSATKQLRAASTVIQSDGKIVVAGVSYINLTSETSDFMVARYTTSGLLDETFGDHGIVFTDFFGAADSANGISIQSDGKIVVTGFARSAGRNLIAVARYTSTGILDVEFDADGKVTTEVSASNSNEASGIAIQRDGKIVVAGWAGPGVGTAVVRYNVNGSLDAEFGNGSGIVVTPMSGGFSSFLSVEIDARDKIVAAGYTEAFPCCDYDYAIARYTPSGILDVSFDTDGIVTTHNGSFNETAYDLAVQPDGKIVIAGSNNEEPGRMDLLRYNVNGSLDNSFDNDGIVATSFSPLGADAKAILLQRDGKILIVGSAGPPGQFRARIGTARYNRNGMLDTDYGTGGKSIQALNYPNANYWALSGSIQPDGKIIIAGHLLDGASGHRKILVARLINSVGALAFDYDGDGKTDISVYRPSEGNWYVMRSSGGIDVRNFGFVGAGRIAPADYDGDGIIDLAVQQQYFDDDRGFYDAFTILNSATNTGSFFIWGNLADYLVPGDYDGDQKANVAVYDHGAQTWIRRDPEGNAILFNWGLPGDKPAPADFNGDGSADMTVFRPSNGRWYTINSGDGSISVNEWGLNGDVPIPADYSGDGKADFCVYRPSDQTWYRRDADTNQIHIITWGLPGDLPVPGDYDGDGKNDLAVFRPSNSTWYIFATTWGIYSQPFGLTGDIPTPNAFVY